VPVRRAAARPGGRAVARAPAEVLHQVRTQTQEDAMVTDQNRKLALESALAMRDYAVLIVTAMMGGADDSDEVNVRGFCTLLRDKIRQLNPEQFVARAAEDIALAGEPTGPSASAGAVAWSGPESTAGDDIEF
jgi:hypothetical protein